jgi:hypothetical protein
MVHPEIRSHKARIRWRCYGCYPPGTPARLRLRVEAESEEVADVIYAAYLNAQAAEANAVLAGERVEGLDRHEFAKTWERWIGTAGMGGADGATKP